MIRGGSQAGKTVFARNVFGIREDLGGELANEFTRLAAAEAVRPLQAQVCGFDEVVQMQILRKKALVQSACEKVQKHRVSAVPTGMNFGCMELLGSYVQMHSQQSPKRKS